MEEFALLYDRSFKLLHKLQDSPKVVKIEDYYFLEYNDKIKFLMIEEMADINLDELLEKMFKYKIEFN